jgi:hypothetical protein
LIFTKKRNQKQTPKENSSNAEKNKTKRTYYVPEKLDSEYLILNVLVIELKKVMKNDFFRHPGRKKYHL